MPGYAAFAAAGSCGAYLTPQIAATPLTDRVIVQCGPPLPLRIADRFSVSPERVPHC